MAKKVTVKWLGQPQAHDYPAALSYHRLCAVYTFDEDAVIPCKIG